MISNDDGVWAKGINELVKSIRDLGNIVVFAPDGPRSGMSGAITSLVPVKHKLIKEEEGLTVYSCTGTPVDCVKLAVNEILDRKPDLLLSGINHGGNMAICVHYSGTIGAAIEGCIFDIPSIAISLTDHSPDADFTECCRIGRGVITKVLEKGLPSGTYLNLNIPDVPVVRGLKVCQQAEGKWVNEFLASRNVAGEPVYWLTGSFKSAKPENRLNDTFALDEGYASLVPCKIDATDYSYLEEIKELF